MLATGFAGTGHAWTVESAQDPPTDQQHCLLRNSTQTISDGYGQTPVILVFSDHTLVLVTKSEIDPSFSDLAPLIDGKPFATGARVAKKTMLIFDAEFPRLIEQFKAGARITVYVRFWPIWPATERIAIQFTLKGFTKAYGNFERCQENDSQASWVIDDLMARLPAGAAKSVLSTAATTWESL